MNKSMKRDHKDVQLSDGADNLTLDDRFRVDIDRLHVSPTLNSQKRMRIAVEI